MKRIVLLSLFISLLASLAHADNFRCPNGAIVSTGDTMAEVSIKCDPPTFKNSRMESEAGYKGATIVINIEEWTYNEGPHRFVHTLVFRNGKLAEVLSLGYGK